LVEPLCRALFSGFASLHNASKRMENMFLSAVGLGVVLILPAGVGISMVADPMVRLCLGEHWLSAVPVVQILAISGTTAIFTQASANLLNAVGRPGVTFYIAIASTLLKLVAFFLLLPRFGLLGAAMAILVASLADLIALLWVALPQVGVTIMQLAACVVRPAISTLVMIFILWNLGMAWTPSQGQDVLDYGKDAGMRSAIGALCYGLALAGVWFAAGRPDGPERLALTFAGDGYRRIRHLTTI
jgi:lipopolysaccharide exporter